MSTAPQNPGAGLIPFPDTPERRLRRALGALDAALAEQRSAVAHFRAQIGDLRNAVTNLDGSALALKVTLASAAQDADDLADGRLWLVSGLKRHFHVFGLGVEPSGNAPDGPANAGPEISQAFLFRRNRVFGRHFGAADQIGQQQKKHAPQGCRINGGLFHRQIHGGAPAQPFARDLLRGAAQSLGRNGAD
jgi:hypothetical protein